MPNTREKLIDLMTAFYGVDPGYYGVEAYPLADHLIANGVTVQKWIPVTERLPDEDGQYLALTKSYIKGQDYFEWLIYYDPEIGFYDIDSELGDIEMEDVTHWMPLPEPPKDVTE